MLLLQLQQQHQLLLLHRVLTKELVEALLVLQRLRFAVKRQHLLHQLPRLRLPKHCQPRPRPLYIALNDPLQQQQQQQQ